MTKLYNIILNPGYDQTDLYSMVSTVTDELLHRSTFFIAECTDEQVVALENHEAVKFCQSDEDVPEIEDAVVKTVNYHRDYNYVQMRKDESANTHPKGNWGLIRHQSQTNNTTFSTDSYSSYSNTYIGDGVDIILQIASVLDPSDPEFMTSGVSRLQTSFQWNTLNGMLTLPTVNYGVFSTVPDVSSHAEAVAYITASNTYGWATGSNLYIWPRDQMDDADKKLNTHGWDAFKLFHQQKGNSRPTIVVDAIQYIRRRGHSKGSVIFRDNIYSDISPAGAPSTAADRCAIVNSGINAYGNSDTPKYGSSYSVFSLPPGGINMDAKNLTDQNKTDILAYIEDITNGNRYSTHIQPIEEMIAAGVHHVSAAGNFNNTIVLPDNIDFNNGALSHMPILVGSNDGSTPQPYDFVPLCRDDLHLAGDTIVCAALGSQFGVDSGLSNKETLASFSNRGDRIDACAAGDNIYMDLHVNGEYEATGTSFASPNIGGMAACVLGKYPTTTPAQLRKYFRENAVGTDTLYDSGTRPIPSSPSGDAPYYGDPLGLRGYSGKIAYLDPSLSFNPSTISNTTITSTQTVSASNKINFTVSQINTKLASIS